MKTMNIRNFLGFTGEYYSINREERNLAAILYHLLLLEGNLGIFLTLIGTSHTPDELSKCSIYFEYAYLRDLWKKDNLWNVKEETIAQNKKKFIIDSLKYFCENDDIFAEIENKSTEEFNKFFGCRGKQVSDDKIQSPANWSKSKMNTEINSNPKLSKAVDRLKFCFNAKPDLVIHLPNDTAICIEAKLESGLGHNDDYYQLETQEDIMNLLGFNAKHILIQKNKKKENGDSNIKTITWSAIFNELEESIQKAPKFIREWNHIKERNEIKES